ncbi:HNH endonuclease [Sphingomonas sp. IC081]|uniref:HNH endonuclease n=1 Tax=Sphingomonas sp. IC081 TaxID=304378 RepID=UPI00115AE14E|nr:HNH endonuclease [Sphingomonas sp. IC081]QDK34754.1 HNH endonuclease [Sphingomonas sp. IC081]
MPTADEFRRELGAIIREAELRGLKHVEINAGELHRQLGGYPGSNHQMPNCCQVMEQERRTLDEIISRPPSGKGASLTIRYHLPR